MTTTGPDSQKYALSRSTPVELVTITSPTLVSLATATVVLTWPPTVLGWILCGLLGLLVAITSGRTSAIEFALIEWPCPETKGDVVVYAIAYNGVLLIGTLLGQMVWTVSNSLSLTAGVGAILPVWFLKHIQLLVFLDRE